MKTANPARIHTIANGETADLLRENGGKTGEKLSCLTYSNDQLCHAHSAHGTQLRGALQFWPKGVAGVGHRYNGNTHIGFRG